MNIATLIFGSVFVLALAWCKEEPASEAGAPAEAKVVGPTQIRGG